MNTNFLKESKNESKMTAAFAFVLTIEGDTAERSVSIHFHLDDAENALRAWARAIVFDPSHYPSDDEIVEMLTAHGIQARITRARRSAESRPAPNSCSSRAPHGPHKPSRRRSRGRRPLPDTNVREAMNGIDNLPVSPLPWKPHWPAHQ